MREGVQEPLGGPAVSRPRQMRRGRRGQAMVEYVLVTVTLFGFTAFGWPFLTRMINSLDAYYQSVYYVIQSPLP